jgi:hypothetical protein
MFDIHNLGDEQAGFSREHAPRLTRETEAKRGKNFRYELCVACEIQNSMVLVGDPDAAAEVHSRDREANPVQFENDLRNSLEGAAIRFEISQL